MIPLATLNAIANTPSRERRRAEAMGFVFGPSEVAYEDRSFGYEIRGSFKCVCGTEEMYRFTVDAVHVLNSRWDVGFLFDPAYHLTLFGSFSRAHLRNDGYSEEAITEMLRKGDEFDRVGA